MKSILLNHIKFDNSAYSFRNLVLKMNLIVVIIFFFNCNSILSQNNLNEVTKKSDLKKETLCKECDSIIGKQSKLNVIGAVFSNINSVADDDPSGITQYFLMTSIPLRYIDGIDTNTSLGNSFVWIRNLYVTPIFVSSSNYAQIDTFERDNHVNSLDLLQYAYLRLPVELNILTFLYHNGSKDYFHFYLDFYDEFFFTNVKRDTIAFTNHIVSNAIGGNIALKSKNGINDLFSFESKFRVFYIMQLGNTVNNDLQPQYRNLSDTSLASNIGKKLKDDNSWFYQFETFINFNYDKILTPYIHFNLVHNFSGNDRYSNSYFQVQLGTKITLDSLFNSILKK